MDDRIDAHGSDSFYGDCGESHGHTTFRVRHDLPRQDCVGRNQGELSATAEDSYLWHVDFELRDWSTQAGLQIGAGLLRQGLVAETRGDFAINHVFGADAEILHDCIPKRKKLRVRYGLDIPAD